MKKKILISIFIFLICLFGFMINPKATYFYKSVDIKNFNGFSNLFNNRSVETAQENFIDIENWQNFYNDLSNYIISQGWTSSFPAFDNMVVITDMRYESYSRTYFPNNMFFCSASGLSINNNNQFVCNDDSTIRINGAYNGVSSSVSGGISRTYPFNDFSNQLYFYTSSPEVYNNSSLQSLLNSRNIDYFLIPHVVINNIYDPNYLNNNSNFNRVCLNNQNTYFSVIPNNIDTSTDFTNNDFMLLNKFLASGGRTILTLSDINTNIITSGTPSNIDWYYNLWSTEYMNSLNTDTNIINFKQKYNFYNNLYGWSIFPNTFSYNKNLNQFSIPVFVLQNSYTYSVDCVPQTVGGSTVCVENDNTHGGGGRNHDNDIDTITENTCFYIPNTHYVKVWELNEFNDIDDTININGTDYNVSTDDFENKYLNDINSNNYSGFIGYFKTMLQRLSVPIIFINSKISLLFSKLPQDIQYMIIGLVAFGFLIGLIRFLTGGK